MQEPSARDGGSPAQVVVDDAGQVVGALAEGALDEGVALNQPAHAGGGAIAGRLGARFGAPLLAVGPLGVAA